MKHLVFLIIMAGAFMTAACSTTGTTDESDQGSATEATSAAPAEAAESQTPTEATTKKAAPAAAESQASASSSSDGSDITFVCTHNRSVRTIKVIYHDEGPDVCEVTYEKSTGTKTLWNANNDKSYCEDKAIEFVTKQEGWGWQCNQQ